MVCIYTKNILNIYYEWVHTHIYNKSILFIKVNTHTYIYPTRLLSPWISPGKNSGVGYHALLQGIFLTQGLNLDFLHRQADSLPSEPPGKSKNAYVYSYTCGYGYIYILVCMEVQIYSPIWSWINSLYVFSRDSLLTSILGWFARNKHIWTCENWAISLVLKHWYILIHLCRQGSAHTHTHTHTHTLLLFFVMLYVRPMY